MNTTNNYPKVMLVGRTNVGKSTLFNRLADNEKSIVFDRIGVTRDYVQDVISWNNKTFNLIDTGGLPLKKEQDPILRELQESILILLNTADLLLFVVDAKSGLTQEDLLMAKVLRKTKKPVFLLINKADNKNALNENKYDFAKLGFKTIIDVSAIHGIGINDLLGMVADTIECKKAIPATPRYTIAILGKPNVGKSSLMNLLLKEERSIVSEVAGTTREAISERVFFHKDLVQFTDTAGIRRQKKVDDLLEVSMVKSSLQTIRTADIILLVTDTSAGNLSDQELKLLFYAYDQHKSIILVHNKTDILDEYHKSELQRDCKKYQFFLKKIPQIWISCKTQKNVGIVLREIKKVWARRNQKFDALEIHELITNALTAKPLYVQSQILLVKKVTVLNRSYPAFELAVNIPGSFGPTQLGFIENFLRKKYDFIGCPILLLTRKAR